MLNENYYGILFLEIRRDNMKTVRLFLVIILLLIISGCKKENVLSNNDNCDVTNCLDVIDWNNSVSEINDIIGVEGTLIDATYNEYHWKINSVPDPCAPLLVPTLRYQPNSSAYFEHSSQHNNRNGSESILFPLPQRANTPAGFSKTHTVDFVLKPSTHQLPFLYRCRHMHPIMPHR